MCGYTLPACIADSKTSECTHNMHTHARTQTYTHAQIHKMSAHMHVCIHTQTYTQLLHAIVDHERMVSGITAWEFDGWDCPTVRRLMQIV